MKRTFRVNRAYRRNLRNRKRRIERRLAPKNWEAQEEPMLQGGNIHYEMAGRTGAVGCGGIGAMHTLAQRLGLVREIDQNLQLRVASASVRRADSGRFSGLPGGC